MLKTNKQKQTKENFPFTLILIKASNELTLIFSTLRKPKTLPLETNLHSLYLNVSLDRFIFPQWSWQGCGGENPVSSMRILLFDICLNRASNKYGFVPCWGGAESRCAYGGKGMQPHFCRNTEEMATGSFSLQPSFRPSSLFWVFLSFLVIYSQRTGISKNWKLSCIHKIF